MVDGRRLVKRFLLLAIIVALVGAALIYALRFAQKSSNAVVAALLPRETVALVQVPDFNRTRDDWHRSDIYKLYTEPAVQEFLRQPLAHSARKNSFSQTVQQIEQLDPKDGFIALTSIAEDRPKIVAGFRFRGSEEATETIIAGWRSALLGPSPKRETIDYQGHQIDTFTGFPISLSTAYDGQWFFAANDLAELKALVDRADGRVLATASPSSGGQGQQSLLAADENFHAAMAEMPASYALGFYLQPKIFAEKLAALRSSLGRNISPNERTMVEHMRCVCAATRFDNGKIHDVIFVAMPKFEEDTTLTRDSLALGTKDTFLYLASLLNFSKQLLFLDPTAGSGVFGKALQRMANTLAQSGITIDDWKATFGPELGALADWPANAHWPSGVVAFPVKDAERAKKIASALLHASDHDAVWKESDRNGVHYIAMQSAPGFLVLRPTVAISHHIMVVGPDPGSVEAAIARSENPTAEFSRSQTYKGAASSLPAPTNFFAYADLALLYSRLDATLRPIVMMGAAFMPGVNEYVDLSRVPPAEIVVKHLSPIVSSQRYQNGGYITESIGPITLNQSGIALIALSVVGGQRSGWLGGLGPPLLFSPSPAISPSPSPNPAGTP